MRRKLNEGRSQIKRKYGEHSTIRVNEKASIRNVIVNFVGKRFVTEEEMKAELTKITEETGKSFDQRQWFKRNQRYFESFENRGQKVWTLSKYGKRVLEFINKPKENFIMENTIGLFKTELFESFTIDNKLNSALNEGVLAKKGATDLEDVNLQSMIDDADPAFKKELMEVCDKLGTDPVNVIQVDSESNEDDRLSKKIYNYLEDNFFGTETFGKSSMGAFSQYDPKLNVVRTDDYGFVGYYFTKDSNF